MTLRDLLSLLAISAMYSSLLVRSETQTKETDDGPDRFLSLTTLLIFAMSVLLMWQFRGEPYWLHVHDWETLFAQTLRGEDLLMRDPR